MDSPSVDAQQAFWDSWNNEYRTGEIDEFMQRQLDVAKDVALQAQLRNARILDVGCGTGWLGNGLLHFGAVTGLDLSASSIAQGRQLYPELELIQSDFATADLVGPFDMVVSADSLAHVVDQEHFVRRIHGLLRPGGIVLLMTQNPAVWNRKSSLTEQGAGQIRNWRSVEELKELLLPCFRIERVSSLAPGGDRGLIWWVENRYVRGGMGRLIGRERWRGLLERMLLGRELVVVARR